MNDMILILNYSDTFSREIALRLRGEQVYGRIVSGMTTSAQIADLQPRGIILSGAAANAPGVFDAGILDLGIPVLALGHASHMLLAAQGGASAGVALTDKKASVRYEDSPLFTDLTGGERWGWADSAAPQGAPDAQKDIGFLTGPEQAAGVLGGGRFVLFLPGEPHKPSCLAPGCTHLRKAVVKIEMR